MVLGNRYAGRQFAKWSSGKKVIKTGLLLSLSILVAAISATENEDARFAEAAKVRVVNAEDAWRYQKTFSWDSGPVGVHALIHSQIRIANSTGGAITGSITDQNGTIISIYGKESVIMARFGYDSGEQGQWKIVARPSNGLFSLAVPARHADADYVKLWVNSNSFVIRPGANETEESYYAQGAKIGLNDDGIFVITGAPPLSFVDVSSDEGIDLQEFPVYQSQIDAKVTSAQKLHRLAQER